MHALDDLLDLSMQQRLAAGHDDHRRAALVGGGSALIDRQAGIQDLVGIVDLAAAGAGEVAAEQRLQHQNQRITLAPGQTLAQEIKADAKGLL